MRLFVALTPPADALADVEAAVEPLRAVQPDLRWIPVERWHLTLAFYGEVPETSLPDVQRKVGRRIGRARLDRGLALRFAGAGQFSRRALWVGVEGDVDPLGRLAQSLSTERRPYRPHLTVARLRGPQDAAPVVDQLTSYAGPGWTAREVHLVRSHLGPKPRYETVATWPVNGSGADD